MLIFSHVKRSARAKVAAGIEFITDYERTLLPNEVKSTDNPRAKSLHLFCNRYRSKMTIKASLRNVGDNMDADTRVRSIRYMHF